MSSRKLQVFALSAGIVFLFYALTASPRITLNDAGDLILAAQTLGVAHAPGYPLFTLLGFVFGKILWFLDPAHQINIMTAMFGAAACGTLALIVYELTENRAISVYSGYILALTSMTWYLSATTEVYTLNLLFTQAIWLLAVKIRQQFTLKKFYWFCFLVGLGLSNSYPLIILGVAGLFLITPVKHLTVKNVAIGFLISLAGLLPYGYFFIQAQRMSELRYAFIDISTVDKIIAYILRKPYVVADQKISFVSEKFLAIGEMLILFAKEFMLATPIVLYGLYSAFKKKNYLRWPLVISTFTSSILLSLLLGVTPDEGSLLQFAEYLLPALSFLTLFLALGLHSLLQDFKFFNPKILAILCGISLITQVVQGESTANQWGNDSIENWGTTLLNSLPQGANLIFCGDESLPLEYLQTVKGIRPDVIPYSSYWGGTRSYLYITGPDVGKTIDSDITVEGVLATSTSPTYVTNCPTSYMERGYVVKLKGLAYQIISEKVPEQNGLVLTAESLRSLLDSILLGPAQGNHWMKLLRGESAKMLLAHGVQSGIVPDLAPLLKAYHLDQDQHFLASLATELAYASQIAIAMNLFHAVGYDHMREVDSGDAAMLCRLLLLNDDLVDAQKICLIPEEKSRICNADSKYNLGRAFWADKAKSLEYLKGANTCNPTAEVIIKALQERQAQP